MFRITYEFDSTSRKLFGHCKRQMIDPAYDRTMVWLRDPESRNRILPPYIGMSEEESNTCRRVYEQELTHLD